VCAFFFGTVTCGEEVLFLFLFWCWVSDPAVVVSFRTARRPVAIR